jgi:hypothetical protein
LTTSRKSSQASRSKTESKPQTPTRSPHDQQPSNTRFDNNSLNPDEAEAIARRLRQIKGYLWNGNLHDGQEIIDDLVMDLEDIETEYASIKALRKAANEFQTYIANNAWMIPNYAERRRYGERVSTGFVESTVNTVVGKRFCKRQQMRWSKAGAHLMLQTRTRTLDGTLRTKFQQWYPGMKSDEETKMAA